MGDGVPVDRRLRVLEAVTDSALMDLDLDKMLEILLWRVRELFVVDTVTLLFVDAAGERLVARASAGLDEEVYQGVRVPIGSGFAGRVARLRAPVQIDRVDSSTVVNPLLWERGLRVLLGVPVVAHGELVGVMHVGSVRPRRFTDEDIEQLRVVADRVAMAASLHRSRSEQLAATTLVDSLMPAGPVETDGWKVAARYVPGAAIGIGGDWYDVFDLPGDRIGVVIGDVVGSGLRAAVVMGRLRSALRAYALEFDGPAEVLGRLDRGAAHFEKTTMATVAYAVIETASARMDLSLAGHLPPVLAFPGEESRFAVAPVDLPVGFGLAVADRRSVSIDLRPGALVAFYTDGLVERRGVDIDLGLARLLATVRPGPPEDVCAKVMAALVGNRPPGDDIALVAVHHAVTASAAR
ncbi:PP2C family protein-serine/threonine phosphatase [Actinophytocola sp. NPDC049390]|uniref:PP2C family protein-serine/threonine phosphatase n=1 Tax=Actinophytocola sp. NPDC049390 TaxID=3363894 RepID=UPI0037B37453